MTPGEAMNVVTDVLLPEKLALLHVHADAIPEIWGLMAAHVFIKTNGLPHRNFTEKANG